MSARTALFLASTALVLSFSTASPAGEQSRPAVPYDFKGDVLGMSLKDFKAKHREPGKMEDKTSCVKGNCKTKKIWKSDMSCDAKGPITECYLGTTILEEGASAKMFFVDDKLAAIGISFGWTERFALDVRQALTDKLGEPSALRQVSYGVEGGFVARWENGVSIAEFQEHSCGPNNPRFSYLWDAATEMFNSAYCTAGTDGLSYQYSYLLFAHSGLRELAQQRVDEETAREQGKAKSDF